eukprot:g37908.t1
MNCQRIALEKAKLRIDMQLVSDQNCLLVPVLITPSIYLFIKGHFVLSDQGNPHLGVRVVLAVQETLRGPGNLSPLEIHTLIHPAGDINTINDTEILRYWSKGKVAERDFILLPDHFNTTWQKFVSWQVKFTQ